MFLPVFNEWPFLNKLECALLECQGFEWGFNQKQSDDGGKLWWYGLFSRNQETKLWLNLYQKNLTSITWWLSICPFYWSLRRACSNILESCFFEGNLKFANGFALAVHFTSKHNESFYILLGPCTSQGKREFTTWLKNTEIPQDNDWIIYMSFAYIMLK